MVVSFNNSQEFLAFLYILIGIAVIEHLAAFVFLFWRIWDLFNILLCMLWIYISYKLRLNINAKHGTLIIVYMWVTMSMSIGYVCTSSRSLFAIDSIINCWLIFLMQCSYAPFQLCNQIAVKKDEFQEFGADEVMEMLDEIQI